MDTFELNKIAGAVLGALLLVMGLGFLAELLYAPPELAQAAYSVEVEGAGEAEVVDEVDEVSIAALLATADAASGEGAARKCVACHTFEPGGANKSGPNLHGVVGRAMAAGDGFAYSGALTERAAAGGVWTYEELNGFLQAPKAWVPGTSMAFAGLRRDGERADMIAYLASVSPDAPPFPVEEQEAAAPAEEDGAAEASATEGTDDAAAPEGDAGGADAAGETDTDTAGQEAGAESDTATPEASADASADEASDAPAAPAESAPASDAPAEETAPSDQPG